MDKKKTSDIYKGVEYLHIVKNKKLLLQLESDEINGLKHSEIQKLIGDKIGEGQYNYVLKFDGNITPKRGSIRAFTSIKVIKKPDSEDSSKLLKMIQQLESKIDNKNSNTDVKDLLDLRKQTYEIQLGFYKERVAQLQEENTRLRKQLEDEGGQGSGNTLETLLALGQAFLAGKSGAPQV